MKAINVRCHVGAQIGAQVFTSLDSNTHGCQLEMTKEGVFVTGSINGKNIDPYFIPHGTIASVRIDPKSFAEAMFARVETKQLSPGLSEVELVTGPPKRKPGRQPKVLE